MKDFSIIGKKFNKLLVLEYSHQDKNKKSMFKCQCDCGKIGIFRGTEVKNNHTKSCGCLRDEKHTKHGYYKTAEYRAYIDMKKRCYNPKNKHYKDYGERGIFVCDYWLGEDGFEHFIKDIGEKPKGKYSLGRINNEKGYYPENCRWETDIEQNRNLRSNLLLTYKGETKCVSEWCEIYNINKSTFKHRYRSGWSINKIIETPVKSPKKYNYKDEYNTVIYFSKKYGKDNNRVAARLRRGCSIVEALELPFKYKTKTP